ncbi:hypothetical protein PHLGIDRAFT_76496 [Phlebiopsis gigantea 11061_1 CR5-6]|uniref:NmrA-like domain-containing protein n=1 Tax=Phlebiopsis gigantea (strain 11061_1 CR5-6) TaxID=745531 RepID=A0A0C3S6G5_PHLG1|nr:hypothetical protein PHLGIDRAFT_76496 [Phlebiopsis gigantea 11061_1 CR5-6]
MATKTILVLGATGKQGASLVAALRPADANAHEFQLLALTRSPTSPAARRLASQPHVKVVEGNLDAPASLRKVFDDAGGRGSIWGVFVVLAFPGLGANADGEERQGILVADLALEYGVSAFIFSSVERGGESYDDKLTLDRAAKVKIERHVRSLGEQGLRWTILRPAFFMENFDGTIGSVTATVLRCGLKPTTKLQLIAADDIGRVAAAVFKSPDANASKILVLTGDILTASEQDAAYVRATGKHLPSVPTFLGKTLLAINGATKGLCMRLDDPRGYDAHLADARAAYPGFTSFEEWAKARRRSTKRDKSWNGVTAAKLATGRQ